MDLGHACREVDLGAPGPINLQIVAKNAAVVDFYHALGYVVEERVSMGKLTTGGS